MPIGKAHPVPSTGFKEKVESMDVYMVTYARNVLSFLCSSRSLCALKHLTKEVPVFMGRGL